MYCELLSSSFDRIKMSTSVLEMKFLFFYLQHFENIQVRSNACTKFLKNNAPVFKTYVEEGKRTNRQIDGQTKTDRRTKRHRETDGQTVNRTIRINPPKLLLFNNVLLQVNLMY